MIVLTELLAVVQAVLKTQKKMKENRGDLNSCWELLCWVLVQNGLGELRDRASGTREGFGSAAAVG